MWELLILFIGLTFLFFLMININKNKSRCNSSNHENFDGNGEYQYKGRGDRQEDIDVLLSRIDWLAKNSIHKSLYTTSYIIAYILLIAVVFILYACSSYILSVWEMILIILSAFVICFSVLNLFNFHTERYNDYYIRNNIALLSEKLNLTLMEPPPPISTEKLNRTIVQDTLYS